MGRIGRLKEGLRRFMGAAPHAELLKVGETAQLPPLGSPPPLDDDCHPSDWLVREGFDRVMAGVEASETVLKRLYSDFRDAVRSRGSGSKETEAMLASLAECRWRWPEFDRWAEIFARKGEWPAAWRNYPSLTGPLRQPPGQVSEAMPYFGYLEMRDILNTHPAGRRPVPLRMEELSQAFLERVTWEEIAPMALEKYQGFIARCQAGREEDLGRLLVSHLRATVYNLIPYHQGLAIQANGLLKYRWELITASQDPLVQDLAARFDSGGIEQLPPFFPGDESRLRLVRI